MGQMETLAEVAESMAKTHYRIVIKIRMGIPIQIPTVMIMVN